MLIWALIVAAALNVLPEFDTTATDGQPVTGRLVELTPGGVVLETTAGPSSLPLSKVAELRPHLSSEPPTDKPSVWIELIDGSVLVGRDYLDKDRQSTLKPLAGPDITLPTSSVAHVRFHEQNEKIAKQWADILSAKHPGDVIVVRSGDSIDFLEGVLGGISDETVQFQLDGEKYPVSRTKVEGLIYAPSPGAKLLAPFCTVINAAGSELRISKATIDGSSIHLVTSAGAEFDWNLSDVSAIRFKVQYLSDLKPESVALTPYIGAYDSLSPSAKLFYQPRFNTQSTSGGLQLGGKRFEKGMTIRSRTEIVYRLPEKFSSLKALAGIDDSVRPEGNIHLTITGDDQKLFEADITGRDKPLPLDVDLTGVRRLKILVDFNGDEVADQLNLCEARILQ